VGGRVQWRTTVQVAVKCHLMEVHFLELVTCEGIFPTLCSRLILSSITAMIGDINILIIVTKAFTFLYGIAFMKLFRMIDAMTI
jgi:hypothetical protein